MIDPKEKAIELVDIFKIDIRQFSEYGEWNVEQVKQCALIAVTNEYNSLREQLFNLRACRVIESEKVYLVRLDELIKQETEVREEIIKIK